MGAIEFEALADHVGEEDVSDWLEITQERVNLFADATDDHQWIHVDVERAKREIGGTIAHGYLTVSLLPFLGSKLTPINGLTRVLNYGSDKVRFTNVVKVGKRIRLRRKLLATEPKAGGTQVKHLCTVEIEGEDRPACVAETIVILFGP